MLIQHPGDRRSSAAATGRSFSNVVVVRVARGVLGGNPPMLKVLAGTILALQLALSAVAAATLVMLHGDGAFFVYAVSVGSPWLLKWRDIADRAAV